MQSRRREHRSSGGELDVFGATSYFAGLPPPASADDDCRCRPSSATEPPPSADRLYFQAAKVVQRDTSTTRTMATEGNSFRGPHQQQQLAGLHGHAERHDSSKQLLQVVASKRQQPYSGKSKLAALLSFMVSPSPSRRANSFRKDINKEAPSSTRLQHQAKAAASAAGAGEKDIANNTCKAANSRSSSSRESIMLQLQGLLGAHDDDDDELVDLGVATGDRRLQGITVVRGIGGDEERWVVRCVPGPAGAWDDEEDQRREKMLDVDAAESASSEQNIKDETMMVEVEQPGHGDDGNIDLAHSWDSDSSSDLFDLDLEY